MEGKCKVYEGKHCIYKKWLDSVSFARACELLKRAVNNEHFGGNEDKSVKLNLSLA